MIIFRLAFKRFSLKFRYKEKLTLRRGYEKSFIANYKPDFQ